MNVYWLFNWNCKFELLIGYSENDMQFIDIKIVKLSNPIDLQYHMIRIYLIITLCLKHIIKNNIFLRYDSLNKEYEHRHLQNEKTKSPWSVFRRNVNGEFMLHGIDTRLSSKERPIITDTHVGLPS